MIRANEVDIAVCGGTEGRRISENESSLNRMAGGSPQVPNAPAYPCDSLARRLVHFKGGNHSRPFTSGV